MIDKKAATIAFMMAVCCWQQAMFRM